MLPLTFLRRVSTGYSGLGLSAKDYCVRGPFVSKECGQESLRCKALTLYLRSRYPVQCETGALSEGSRCETKVSNLE
jgi:hypothetical protein